jgi:hypothetical protein
LFLKFSFLKVSFLKFSFPKIVFHFHFSNFSQLSTFEMVAVPPPLPGTLVYIWGGTYRNCVGRLQCYTASRVCIDLLEDSSGASFHGPITINPSHCRRLGAGDVRAAPYPEVLSQAAIVQQQATHPLRHALVDLAVAHASTTADFDDEIDKIIQALNARVLQRHAAEPY